MSNSTALPSKIGHIIYPSDVPSKSKSTLAKPLNVVKYNTTGQYFLSAGNDKKINLFNAYSGAHIKTYEAHGYEITDLAVSFDNAKLVSCGGDKQVFYWDVAEGVTIRRFSGHSQRVNTVAFNADASIVVSGSFDATVRLWDTKSNSQVPIQVLDQAKDSVTALATHRHQIITGSGDGRIRTYDLRKGLMTVDVIGHPVVSLQPANDGQTVLVSTLDSKVRLFDNANGGLLQEFSGHRCRDYRIPAVFSDTEAFIMSGSEDGRVVMWNVVSGKKVHDLSAHDGKVVSGLAMHPKGGQVISCGGDGNIVLWTT
ncbi:protein of unknown function [Taphrina deformans PYCC 5710]|uniref:Uncharacterized protein n=1 Tax=Taphrina deformans (strain PYCC 5710 / ATCC 11124 / CBS 356.35 / IMI 108563 / JCM 9778 / NBRC 8474) TaxID=1097556 RepID=R4XGB3_TAPDE|nr:protein of unknown function [Taphrina deformans PYCC 5710]|eukprot:CCG84942.1 protein of unknown function [Taphrina deformans PYCC 5710]